MYFYCIPDAVPLAPNDVFSTLTYQRTDSDDPGTLVAVELTWLPVVCLYAEDLCKLLEKGCTYMELQVGANEGFEVTSWIDHSSY